MKWGDVLNDPELYPHKYLYKREIEDSLTAEEEERRKPGSAESERRTFDTGSEIREAASMASSPGQAGKASKRLLFSQSLCMEKSISNTRVIPNKTIKNRIKEQ